MQHFTQQQVDELRARLTGPKIDALQSSDTVVVNRNGKNLRIDASKIGGGGGVTVKIGAGLGQTSDGTVYVKPASLSTDAVRIVVGTDGIKAEANIASAENPGVIKIGKRLSIDNNGVLSADEQITADEKKKIAAVRVIVADGTTIKEKELEDGSIQLSAVGGGNVDDVKVNGESVVVDKIANIDLSGYQTKEEADAYVLKAGDTMTGTLNVPSISGVGSITLDEAGTINTTGTHIDINAKYPRFPNIVAATSNSDRQMMVFSPSDSAISKTGTDFTYNAGTKTMSVSNINTNSKSTAVAINTGTNANSYFQSQKFRGQGNASEYRHAIDFGYSGHDQVDFYEYGGKYNFWQNQSATKPTNESNIIASLQRGKLVEQGNTLTYPGKSGTIALQEDINLKIDDNNVGKSDDGTMHFELGKSLAFDSENNKLEVVWDSEV